MGQKWNSMPILLALTLAGCATLLEPVESRNQRTSSSDSWRSRRTPAVAEETSLSAAAPESRPGDVGMGMTRSQVLRSWGDPVSVEAAGSQNSGNEKWTYSEASTSYWQGRYERVIYFENGRVVGWQTR